MYKGNFIAAIWLIGLVIIFVLDIFWPGIIVVTCINLVARRFLPVTLMENLPEPFQISSEK